MVKLNNKRKYQPISIHQTLYGQLTVNWEQEYNNEFRCPLCNVGDFTRFNYREGSTCKITLSCNHCRTKSGLKKTISLTCQVKAHIYNYRADKECPNPLCTQIGRHGQKGWIYKIGGNASDAGCYFCGIKFKYDSSYSNSWFGSQIEDKVSPFCFDDDIWDLRNFFNKPYQKQLIFQKIQPHWYKQEAKKYIFYLLKSKRFTSDSQIRSSTIYLKQFGKIVKNSYIENKLGIKRDAVRKFLGTCKNNKNKTINRKLASLRDFFDYLNLDSQLIRSRDFLKERKNEPDWLDEITRKAIKQHIEKIPAP